MKNGSGLPAASHCEMIFSATLPNRKKAHGKYHPATRSTLINYFSADTLYGIHPTLCSKALSINNRKG
jgi:hypothetical protein